MHELPAVTYGRGGDALETIRSAIAGHPVKVDGKASCFTLAHKLDGMPEAKTHTIFWRNVGGDQWLVFVVPRASVTGCN